LSSTGEILLAYAAVTVIPGLRVDHHGVTTTAKVAARSEDKDGDGDVATRLTIQFHTARTEQLVVRAQRA